MQPPKPNPARNRLAFRRNTRGMIGWMIWVLLLTTIVGHIPSEVSYWQLALADHASLEGRTEDALAWIERARQWSIDETLPLQRQVAVLARDGKDPIAAIDAVLQEDPPAKFKANLHLQKSAVYQTQEKYSDALKEYDAAADFRADLRPATARAHLLMRLDRKEEAKREMRQAIEVIDRSMFVSVTSDNEVAYNLALLGDNLEEALKRANRAVAQQPEEPALLDTRGYVHYRMGAHELALADLNRAVELVEKRQQESAGHLATKLQRQMEKEMAAVILYHRSLALEALEKPVEAERDHARIRELGFEPGDRLF